MSQQLLKYLGSIDIKKNKTYTSDAIIDNFASCNVLLFKNKVNVSINATDAINVDINEVTFIEDGMTFIFTSDSVVVACEYKGTL